MDAGIVPRFVAFPRYPGYFLERTYLLDGTYDSIRSHVDVGVSFRLRRRFHRPYTTA
jgi:hypothetical protein